MKNIDKIYNNLKEANYKITFDMEENSYKQNDVVYNEKEFLIQDPDGYLLRFAEEK